MFVTVVRVNRVAWQKVDTCYCVERFIPATDSVWDGVPEGSLSAVCFEKELGVVKGQLNLVSFVSPPKGEDKAAVPVTDTEFSQSVNPQSFCTGVSLHHPALIQNTGPLIDMSDIRPGTSE